MNEKVRFVFSTRSLGTDKAFACSLSLSDSSPIRAYLIKHFTKSEDDVYGWFKLYYMSQGGDFDKKYPKIGDLIAGDKKIFQACWLNEKMKNDITEALFSSGIVSPKIASEISYCPGANDSERFKSRFSYYRLQNNSDLGYEAFAVPHLEWAADKDWIDALIDESFGTKNDYNTLYLVLHDNDVPGYEKKTFRFLTAEETFNLLCPEEAKNIARKIAKITTEIKELESGAANYETDEINSLLESARNQLTGILKEKEKHILEGNDGELFYKHTDGKRINIIVFQHTWNDVMAILKDNNITSNGIYNRLGPNKKTINDIFKSKASDLKELFNGLIVDASVDLCQNVFLESEIEKCYFKDTDSSKSERPDYFVSEDNGALLTELMHVKTDIHSSEQFLKFVNMLKAPSIKIDSLTGLKQMRFPLIIKVYKSFFDDWENAVTSDDDKEKIRNHTNKKAMEENLERAFTFFNNSSIWIRLVDINDEIAYSTAVSEFKYFDKIGLYDYPSAWENLEYNLRIFEHNYLESSLDGHGNFVTPVLYGNETEAREILCGNCSKM